MNNNPANSQSLEIAQNVMQSLEGDSGIKVKILKHVKDKFSLDLNQVFLKAITSRDLPIDVKSYYVEKKTSYGNLYYNYFVYDNNLFCSEIENDFENLLKEFNFLIRKNLSVIQFWNIFQALKLKYKSGLLIDQTLLANPYNAFKPVINQLSLPQLEYLNDRATFTFFIFDDDNQLIRRYTVNISPSYQTEINYTDLKIT